MLGVATSTAPRAATASAAGLTSATLRADELGVDGSRINRQTFERLRLTAAIGDTALDARLDARSGSDSARVAISAAPALDPTRATITGASQFDTLDSLLARDVRNAGLGISFRATFARPPGPRPRPLSAEAQIDGWVRAGQCRLDTVALVAKFADGALDVSRLTAVGTAFALEGAGRLALTHSASGVSDFRVGGQLRDVSTLAPVVRVTPSSAGSGQLALEAHGPAGATEFQGLAVVLMPRVGEMWADSVAVRIHGTWADSSLKALDAHFVGRAMTVGPLLPRDVTSPGRGDGREAGVKLHSVTDRDFGEDISLRYRPGPSGSAWCRVPIWIGRVFMRSRIPTIRDGRSPERRRLRATTRETVVSRTAASGRQPVSTSRPGSTRLM